MSKNLVYIGVAVLAIIVVILGYNIYQKSPLGTLSQSTPVPQSSQPPKITLSQEELEVLKPPANDAPNAEKERYGQLLKSLAENTSEEIVIGDSCIAKPLVLQIRFGRTLKIRNEDTKEHTLNFPGKDGIEVAPGQSTSLVIDFGTGGTVLGYGCDSLPGPAGTGVIGILTIFKP